MLQLGIASAPSSERFLDEIDPVLLARYDAFFDNPVPFRYRQLAAAADDARWIVTQRETEPWLTSMRWLFGPGLDRLDPATRRIGDHVHRVVYGTDRFDEDRLRTIYNDHYTDVQQWIVDRPHVWLHVEDGLAWEPICTLVNRPVPSVPFPHSNATPGAKRRPASRWTRRSR